MSCIPPTRRLLTLLLGYVAAALAGAIIATSGYLLLGHMAYGRGAEWVLIPVVAFAFVRTVGISLLPVAIIIAITEAFSIRAVSAYVLLGVFVFIGCTLYLAPHSVLSFVVLSGMTSAGIIAGLVYWRIAGRSAGTWRERGPTEN